MPYIYMHEIILTESAFNLATYTTAVDISTNMPAFTWGIFPVYNIPGTYYLPKTIHTLPPVEQNLVYVG